MGTLQGSPPCWHGAQYPQEARRREVILTNQEGTSPTLGDSLFSLRGTLLILGLSQGCFLLNLVGMCLAVQGHTLRLEDTDHVQAQVKDHPPSLQDTLLAQAGLGCTLNMDAGTIPPISPLTPHHPLLVSKGCSIKNNVLGALEDD